MRAQWLLSIVVSTAALAVTAPAMAQYPYPPPPPVIVVEGPPPPPPPMVVMVRPMPPPPPPPAQYTEYWYGWQTLIADGATLALWIGGSAANTQALTDVGWASYLLAPPIIHWAHGKVGIGFASLGIRIAAPLVLGLTGLAVGCAAGGSSGNSNNGLYGLAAGCAVGFGVGVLTGYAGAVVLDAAVFSYKKERVVQGGYTATSFTIQPNLSLVHGHETLGVLGTF
jgi:hypothetical protein